MKTKNVLYLLAMSAILLSACKKKGCTDPMATNFSSEAEKDDGSCFYDAITLDCNAFQSSNSNAITFLENRNDGVDYIIDCKATVSVDLVIEPGVTIEFTNQGALVVTGSLSAVGTSDKRIVFSGRDKVAGSWGFVAFNSNSVNNKLENCTIEYAGGFQFSSNGDRGNVLLISDARASINNCIIRNGEEYGVKIPSIGNNLSQFNDNTITACNVPVYIPANHVHKINGGNYTGNQINSILISSSGGNAGVVEESVTWQNLNVPYRAGKEIVISCGNLTIAPGTTIQFENGTGIVLQNIGNQDCPGLICVGTADNKIRLTGVTQTAGAWKQIDFRHTQNPSSEISHTIIEYAGNPDSDGAIRMWNNPVVKVTYVDFMDIGTCAMYAGPSGNVNLTENNNTTVNVAGGYICD